MILSRRRLAAALLVAPLSASLVLAPLAARAQWTVYDPANYVQNVLTAARTLQQINNQISSLQNQAQMLIGQAKTLASLPYSSLAALQAQVDRTRQLLGQAQALAYDVAAIQKAFTTNYGAVDLSAGDAALSNATGIVDIVWSTTGEGPEALFVLKWKEHGGPPVVAPTRRGFGSRLIETSISGSPSGGATTRFEPDGLAWTTTARLAAIQE